MTGSFCCRSKRAFASATLKHERLSGGLAGEPGQRKKQQRRTREKIAI
jgi:hypothetical protein